MRKPAGEILLDAGSARPGRWRDSGAERSVIPSDASMADHSRASPPGALPSVLTLPASNAFKGGVTP